MTYNIKISFHHLLSKKNKKGLSPVYGVITILGKKTKLTTGVWLSKDYWDDKKQKVNHKHPRRFQLNNESKKFEENIFKLFDEATNNGKVFSVTHLKNAVHNTSTFEEKTILSAYRNYIRKLHSSNTRQSTIKKWETLTRDVQAFLNLSYRGIDLSIKTITKEFIEGYEKYLFNNGNIQNTVTAKTEKTQNCPWLRCRFSLVR